MNGVYHVSLALDWTWIARTSFRHNKFASFRLLDWIKRHTLFCKRIYFGIQIHLCRSSRKKEIPNWIKKIRPHSNFLITATILNLKALFLLRRAPVELFGCVYCRKTLHYTHTNTIFVRPKLIKTIYKLSTSI